MEILLGVFAVAFLILFNKTGLGPLPSAAVTGKVLSQKETVMAAITSGIVEPLGLPDVAGVILMVQSKLETAAWSSPAFKATNSLFNRHAGSGRGEWLGAGKNGHIVGKDVYYAGPGDADIRMYTDVFQSARDMKQLLTDGLYAQALAALRKGSAPEYYNALGAAGFAADPSYAKNLLRNYEAIA